jgi:small subunit ribosomal protein S17e
MEVLAAYKEKFGTDFVQNKIALNEISIIRSKGLKNELAGYITTFIKREIEEQKEKEAQAMQDAQSTEQITEPQEEELLT